MEHVDPGLPEMAIDAERARAFVLAHGGLREAARLYGIFGRQEPERAVIGELERLQNPDGGFPIRQEAGAPSSVDTTCCLLAQMREIPPLGGSPMASRALAFLRRSQQPDGSWAEPPEVQAVAPWWSREANPQAAAYLTANAAYTLLVMEPAHMDPILRGSRWLRTELGRVGAGEQACDQTLFLAAAVWAKVLGPGSAETARVYDLLDRRELDAPNLAWWLRTVVETGLEARFFPLILRQLRRLAAMQRADGSFPAEEGFTTESTLAALRVFRGFRLI